VVEKADTQRRKKRLTLPVFKWGQKEKRTHGRGCVMERTLKKKKKKEVNLLEETEKRRGSSGPEWQGYKISDNTKQNSVRKLT